MTSIHSRRVAKQVEADVEMRVQSPPAKRKYEEMFKSKEEC